MKIRMLTTRCGADTDNNWTENQVRNVSVEEAIQRVQVEKVAIALEPFPTEKVTVQEPVKSETPKSPSEGVKNSDEGKGTGEGEKPASWGKGGKK